MSAIKGVWMLLSDIDLRIAVPLRLELDVCRKHRCRCAKKETVPVDDRGYHQLSYGTSIMGFRHDCACDITCRVENGW